MKTLTRNPTEFEKRVYKQLGKVPCGKVTTYAELGHALGCGSAQAIGQALKRNPYAPEVPCHRVIRTDLTIGGFSGEIEGAKIRKKLRLLKQEGVEFDREGRLATADAVFRFVAG